MIELNRSQLRQYDDVGFVLLKGLIDLAEIRRFEERFETLVTAQERPAGMKLMQDVMVVKGAVQPKDPMFAINKLLAFENDEVLFGYAENQNLLSAVRGWVGDRPYVIASNVFNKPPEVDGRHPMHQDLKYFTLRPPEKIVGCWTAISSCTRDNGCLAVIPGSHKGALLEHKDPDWEYVNYAFLGVETDARDTRVHLEMEPGDTLLFHPLLIHGSGHNKSDACRRAISVHFAHPELITAESREFSRARQVNA